MTDNFDGYPLLASQLYERPDNYAGAHHFGTATLYGHHRDSDIISESNWDFLVRKLADDEHVYITREGHWAVGWVEFIRVKPTATDETKAWCEDQLRRLKDYPILDEDDVSERELEAAHQYWNGWSEKIDLRHRVDEIKRWNERHSHWPKEHRIPIFAARHDLHKLSELYPDFEQWICDIARE